MIYIMKTKTKKYVEYDEYVKNSLRKNQMIINGWELLEERSRVKGIIGSGLFIYGVLTLWCPFSASIIAISVGSTLMASAGIDIILIGNINE